MLQDAIKSLSRGKSPGIDNLPAELIKASDTFGKQCIHILIKRIWETCEWPSEWKQQEFVVLFKSGDMKECSNYRTIALISHISKILLYIILKRLSQKIQSPRERHSRSLCADPCGTYFGSLGIPVHALQDSSHIIK